MRSACEILSSCSGCDCIAFSFNLNVTCVVTKETQFHSSIVFTIEPGFSIQLCHFLVLSVLGEAGGKKMTKPQGCQKEGELNACFGL